MFITQILFIENCVINNICIYLHRRTATKIRNLAEIRNSINALKVRKL